MLIDITWVKNFAAAASGSKTEDFKAKSKVIMSHAGDGNCRIDKLTLLLMGFLKINSQSFR